MTTRRGAGSETGARRRGRPSVADDRQEQIVDAYLHELAVAGMVTVPVGAVAERAGISRTAVAHFVGDRHTLHTTAVRELERRYEAQLRCAIGATPTALAMVDTLFAESWVRDRSTEDLALDHYVLSALREPEVAEPVRAMFRSLVDELAAAIRRDHPGVGATASDECAYAIVCLSEFNITLQQLGFARRRSASTRDAARHLLDALTAGER